MKQIEHALQSVSGASFNLTFRGWGFFPTLKAARVFWVGIDAGTELSALAMSVDATTAALGVPKEDHVFSPHLTLARGGRGSGSPGWKEGDGPNRAFSKLQEKIVALPMPEFGTMTARAFFLYQSQLQRGGPLYAKLAKFVLT
jgi:2'-5' RNA ligase